MADGDGPTTAPFEGVEEARRTFDKQVELLRELEDQALRTARISVLILGVGASALGFTGPESVVSLGFVPMLCGFLGVFLLTMSAFVGLFVNQGSQYSVGLSVQELDDITAKPPVSARHELLNRYEEKTRVISSRIEEDDEFLSASQILLILGLSVLLFGSMTAFLKARYMVTGVEIVALFSSLGLIFLWVVVGRIVLVAVTGD